MKKSLFGRSLELAKLAAQVGLKELQSGDLRSRVDQAVLIAKSLSQLKGAAMKAGQLLSLELDNYFPPEAIKVLSQLQNAAVAQPFEEIQKILNDAIRAPYSAFIESISETPLGVASIGQVHRARYRGREIVLKVQFSDVADSIESDLKLLKTLAASFCKLTGRKMDLDPLFQEFRSVLEQEVDYEVEAKFQTQFYEKLAQLSRTSAWQFRAPQVIPELSSKRVLAMSFETGVTLREWINKSPGPEQKEQMARAILDLYFHEFFEWGLVQTDPNWGNFLVETDDSGLRICCLDFGATRSYSPEFVKNYISLLDYAARGQSKQLRALSVEMGLIDPRESEEAWLLFEKIFDTAIKPFFASQSGSSTFDFSDERHALESQATAKQLAQALVWSAPPYRIAFLHRKLAGVYSILKKLEARLDIAPYWEMMRTLSDRQGLKPLNNSN